MNITTNAMQRLTKILTNTHEALGKMATEPYGVRKLTEREQWDMYKNLTAERLGELIEEQGLAKVNDWLYRMEQKEAQYGGLE